MQVEERCGDSASQSARVPARSCRTQRGRGIERTLGIPPLREPTSLYRGQLLPMALNNPPKHPQLQLDYGADAQNTLLTTLTLCSRDSQSDTAAPQRHRLSLPQLERPPRKRLFVGSSKPPAAQILHIP
jgi:hypothetical protein